MVLDVKVPQVASEKLDFFQRPDNRFVVEVTFGSGFPVTGADAMIELMPSTSIRGDRTAAEFPINSSSEISQPESESQVAIAVTHP